jgi:hypothetical protein
MALKPEFFLFEHIRHCDPGMGAGIAMTLILI